MRLILIGGDRTVYFLTRQLIEQGHHVTLINRDYRRSRQLARQTKATVIQGDGTNPKVLEEALARRADAVLALTPADEDNLIACQIAKKLYGVPQTIALANDPDNEQVFRKLGVSAVLSTTKVIASLIEQQTHFEEITALMPIADGKVTISDVRLERGAPCVGKRLDELDISDETLIAGIIRDGEVIIPRGANQLFADDHILVISSAEAQEKDLTSLIGRS